MTVLAAFLSNTLFNFTIGLLLARFLGPEDYGRFAVALAVAVMIQTVAFDWARLAAARFYSSLARRNDPVLRATLDASLAGLVLMLVAATILALLSGVTAPLSPALAGLAVATAIANGLFDFQAALLRARFDDGLYARLIVGKNVLSAVLTAGGAWCFGSAKVALLGLTLSMVGAMLGLGRHLRDPKTDLRHAEARRAAGLVRYAMPVVLANLFYQSIPLADRLLIARLHGLAESGQFSFAYDIGVRIVAAVGSMLDVLLFQIAVRAHEAGPDLGREQVGRNIGIVVAVLTPACLGCFLVLPSFEALLAPPEFRGAFARYLALLLPGLFGYGLIFFALQPMFQIAKTTGVLVAVAALASVVNLCGAALLPDTGDPRLFAVVQGFAMAAGVVALILAALYRQPIWPRPRDLGGAILASLAMAAAVLALGPGTPGFATLVLQVLVGVAVYAATAVGVDLCGVRTDLRARWRHRASRF